MKTRKLIVLDTDGTLYDGKKPLTPSARATLIAAQERGHVLVLASARPCAALSDLAGELEMEQHHGLLLGYHGGLVTDCTSGETLYSRTIPVSMARALTRHLEGFSAIPLVDDGQTLYTDHPDAPIATYESGSNRLEIKAVPNVSAAIGFSPVRILIFMPVQKMMKYRADMAAPFTGELSFSPTAPFFLEATPLGVDRAGTLEKICGLLDIVRENIVIFGAE